MPWVALLVTSAVHVQQGERAECRILAKVVQLMLGTGTEMDTMRQNKPNWAGRWLMESMRACICRKGQVALVPWIGGELQKRWQQQKMDCQGCGLLGQVGQCNQVEQS